MGVFDNGFSSKKVDHSRESEIKDIMREFSRDLAVTTHIFNFTVKNIKKDTEFFKGIEMVYRLNTILEILTKKKLGCRLQRRLPYLLEQESPGSSYFKQVQDYTHIEFDNLPDECHPVLKEDLTKSIDEIINIQLNADSSINIIEKLGQYSPRTGFCSSEKGEPSISIDIDKIDRNSLNLDPDKLAVIVLVHELCHALLDPNNYYRYTEKGTKFITPKIKYETAYGCLKEEAIANAMTYKFILKLGDETLLSEAESFMSSQPDAYLYGYLLAQNPEWNEKTAGEEWIIEKIEGSEEQIQREWIESMSNTIKLHR